jgi:hypothetical protein
MIRVAGLQSAMIFGFILGYVLQYISNECTCCFEMNQDISPKLMTSFKFIARNTSEEGEESAAAKVAAAATAAATAEAAESAAAACCCKLEQTSLQS